MLSAAAPSRRKDRPGPPEPEGSALPAWVRRSAYGLLVVQLVVMLLVSAYGYRHYAETYDFAIYTQAWTSIAHGHLDPYSTILGTTFWHNNSEFVMWPLAALYWIHPHPDVLLWVQDLSVVATEAVTFDWMVRILDRSAVPPGWRRVLGLGVAVVLVLDPWAWNVIAVDFHTHALATLLVVLAGRDMWSGRTRRVWIWAVGAILCVAPAALYVIGLGAATFFTCRATRRTSVLLMGAGAAWFLLVTQLGADGGGGGNLGRWYGYLVSGTHRHVGLGSVLVGAAEHPMALSQMIGQRWPIVFAFVAVMGLIGVASPWGLFPSAVVFLPSIFILDPVFLTPGASFQSWPALPFVLIGTVTVVAGWSDQGQRRRWLAVGAGVVWGVAFVAITAGALPRVPSKWLAVSDPAAAELARLERAIPPDAEVLAVNGVMGRFAARSFVYQIGGASQRSTFPVREPTLVFVISSTQGVGDPVFTTDPVLRLQERLGASLVVAGYGIYGLEWTPPPGTRSVSVP